MQISPSSNVSKLLYLFVASEMNTREHWFWVSSDHRERWKSKKAFAFVLDTHLGGWPLRFHDFSGGTKNCLEPLISS